MSNTETMQKYVKRYKEVLDAYKELKSILKKLPEAEELEKNIYELEALEKSKKLEFISEDLEDLFTETNEGLNRISNIVKL